MTPKQQERRELAIDRQLGRLRNEWKNWRRSNTLRELPTGLQCSEACDHPQNVCVLLEAVHHGILRKAKALKAERDHFAEAVQQALTAR